MPAHEPELPDRTIRRGPFRQYQRSPRDVDQLSKQILDMTRAPERLAQLS